MNTAIQCITLLACAAICSASAVKYCRCVNTVKRVKPSLIILHAVKESGPRPYCKKQEVIVTLKNGRSQCLDPEEEFTKRLLEKVKMLRMTPAEKVNTMIPKSTTESATMSATESLTESATASFTESAAESLTESATASWPLI